MDLLNKNVLVIGLGVSGISTIKALDKFGAIIWVTDTKEEEKLKEVLESLEGISVIKQLGVSDIELTNIDLIIKSPGVPPHALIIQKAVNQGIEVINDIELGYRLKTSDNFIAITGTNGKTTTTRLVGEVLKAAGYKIHVVGNIGTGILGEIVDSKKNDIFVIETSSFQLEHTRYFKPKVSLILSLAPDHIDWHQGLENYFKAKARVFQDPQTAKYCVLNAKDSKLLEFSKQVNGTVTLSTIILTAPVELL